MIQYNLRRCAVLIFFSFSGMLVFAQKKHVAKKTPVAVSENKLVKNNIHLTAKGLKVSEAYLALDDESLVPDDNKVTLNQNVNLVLVIDDGWTETDGKVFPGGKQVIKMSNGTEILNSDDLFAAFNDTGVSAADGRYITLTATITDLKDASSNHVIINFNVWDKKGTGNIKGSYSLYIQ